MPHCIVEHSAELAAETLIAQVFAGASESGLFAADGADIKVRTVAYSHYCTGPRKSAFVHVELKILSGRTLEMKQHLSTTVLAHLRLLDIADCSLTVEVVDMERASYAKWVS